jgi:hypothetical protein
MSERWGIWFDAEETKRSWERNRDALEQPYFKAHPKRWDEIEAIVKYLEPFVMAEAGHWASMEGRILAAEDEAYARRMAGVMKCGEVRELPDGIPPESMRPMTDMVTTYRITPMGRRVAEKLMEQKRLEGGGGDEHA